MLIADAGHLIIVESQALVQVFDSYLFFDLAGFMWRVAGK
jgi:hypothetical protein